MRACKRETSDTKEFNFVLQHYFPEKQLREKCLERLNWVQTDVLEIDTLTEALKGIDWVYHCAALVSFQSTDKDLLLQVNAEGTANLVNLCLFLGISKFSYVSSIASLGRTKSGNTMNEDSNWESSKLNSNYAISKYKAELEVWRGAEEGLEVYIVNPGVIIGVGDFTKGSNALVQSIYKGLPFYSMGVNGYVDVKDVARALIQLGKENKSNKKFVLVGANLRFRDLFFMLADALKVKRPFIEIRPWSAALAWRVMAVVSLFTRKGIAITKETARASVNESYYDSTRIKTEIEFVFTPIEETIRDCAQAYLLRIA